ncbi:MAG TPA: hypothetical protein VNA12_08330 [Mycobacteriales bacterium]|nr:hypothetical protein [Mycobacteriales bacterium]
MSQLSRLVALGASAAIVVACSGGGPGDAAPLIPRDTASTPIAPSLDTPPSATPPAVPTPGSPGTAAPPAAASTAAAAQPIPAEACPTAYAAPDPRRPVVTLAFWRNADGTRVLGQEKVRFTPDKPIDELVFRLWANAPRTASAGVRMTVYRAEAAGAKRFTVESAGAPAGSPGTLLRLKLLAPVPAGQSIDAVLDFDLALGAGSDDRIGRSGSTAWWASGFPLLAWERGRGWAREPATRAFAEATTSEAFDLRAMTVEAPAGEVVLATGRAGRVETGRPGGRTRHYFSAPAVRDVMVASGPFRVSRRTEGGVPIAVGVAPGLRDDPARLAQLHAAALRAHVARFGRYPFSDLNVAVVPTIRGGIEYPGAILLGPGQVDATLSHEVAHQWFYGLVGDNQGRDPWLDEAFATYAEAMHRGTGPSYRQRTIPPAGVDKVGWPMTYWDAHRADYFRSVYIQGAVMLMDARTAVGAARFDTLLRCYVAIRAHTVSAPVAIERAFRDAPEALRIFRRDGALPR